MDRPRLSEHVSDSLIRMIAAGELRVGDPLPSELELAGRFKVSKPTVRESLKQLALYGIVEIRQGKVARVRSLDSSALEGFFRIAVQSTDNGLRDALEFRRAIEIENAELAAARATQAQLAEMEAAIKVMAASIDSLEAWLEADFNFHMALAAASGNAIMMHAMEALSGVIRYTMRVVAAQTDLRNPRLSLRRHRGILAAIASHDAQQAATIMREHFDAARPVLEAISRDRERLAHIW